MKIACFLIALACALTSAAAEPAPSAPPKPGFTLADLKAQVPVSAEGYLQMEVPALLNTITDPEVQTVLTGQSVETTGQIMLEAVDNAEGRRFRIFRAQLLCCSSHARQCSVSIQFSEKAPELKELSWVKLVGTVTYRMEEKARVPVVLVRQITAVSAPANPLLP